MGSKRSGRSSWGSVSSSSWRMWSGRSSRDRSPTRIPGERFRDSSRSCACPVCQRTRCRSWVCRTAGAARGLPRHRDRLGVPEDGAREARGRLVVAALEGGPGLLQRLADFAHVPSDVARPLRGLQGLRHVLQRIGPGDSRLRLTRLFLENLVPQRLHRMGRGRRWGLSLRRSGRPHLGIRGRRWVFRLRFVGHFDPARFERRGDVLLRLEKTLLFHRELFAFRGEVVQFILERGLQFDERVVLRRGLLLAGVHLFADFQHLPIAGFERVKPLVLELDEFLFALRQLPVALGHTALHHGEPIDRLRERALPLRGQLLTLDERLDLSLGLFQVIRKLVLEALHLILAVLDRLLPVVQRAGPVLDAPLLGGRFVPFHPHAGDVLVHRRPSRDDLVPLLGEIVPLRLQPGGLILQRRGPGVELRSERVELLPAGIQGVLRFPQFRGLSLHRVEEDGGGLVTGHVRSPPVSRQNELVHPTLYKPSSAEINYENKSHAREEKSNRVAEVLGRVISYLLRAGPASRTLARPRRDPPSLCQQTSDKRKTLIALLSYSRQHASIWWRNEGMEHACTQGDLVRVRAADRRGEGPPAEQGSGHEHAAVHEGRQREAPGHHLG